MGDLSAVALILALIIIAVVFVFLVFVLLRARAAMNASSPVALKTGPLYSQQPKWFDYYRVGPAREASERGSMSTAPRKDSLPRCPNCATAIAYEQERCHKCGEELRKFRT